MNAVTPAVAFRTDLSRMKDQIKAALPPHISVDKFSRVAMTAIQNEPGLLEYNKQSLFSAIIQCATDGLLPDKREAALVPYDGKVNYMPMIGGILKKLRNSGELDSLYWHVVYDGEEFSFYVDGDGEHLHHKPNPFGGGDMTKAIGVYAVARLKGSNERYIERMSRAQIMSIKKKSKGAGKPGSPWNGGEEDQMWGKVVVRRLCKRLPSSSDLDHVFEADNASYENDPPPTPPADPTPPATPAAEAPKAPAGTSKGLAAALGAAKPVVQAAAHEPAQPAPTQEAQDPEIVQEETPI